MTFAWPAGSLLALVVPALLATYLLALRRRRRSAVPIPSLGLLHKALPGRSRWRRHAPVGLLLVSLGLLALATARPEVTSEVPLGQASVILALDESGSMCSTDVLPNRLTVAQQAARTFVNSLPPGTVEGLVQFSGFAELAVAPTRDRQALDRGIEQLSPSPGTAIGAAILESLDAISEVDPRVKPVGNAVTEAALGPSEATGTNTTAPTQKPGLHGYVPDVVVLLTDGSNNRGIEPLQAVPYAVSRGVRIYTIGFGTTHPGPLRCTAQQLGGEVAPGGFGGAGSGGRAGGGYGGGGGGGYGGFRGPGGRSPLVADLPTLRKVSRLTGGASFKAQDAAQLARVFANLPKEIAVQKERHEISALVAAVAGLMALAAAAASMRWSPYP